MKDFDGAISTIQQTLCYKTEFNFVMPDQGHRSKIESDEAKCYGQLLAGFMNRTGDFYSFQSLLSSQRQLMLGPRGMPPENF